MLNDKCNDAYGLIYASSMFVSPLVGSILQTGYGQRVTCDILMIGNLIVGVFLLIFNCGPLVFKENREFRTKLENLQAKLQEDDMTYGYESHLTMETKDIPGRGGRTKSDRKVAKHFKGSIRFELKNSLAYDP